jgi:hypothetical protein
LNTPRQGAYGGLVARDPGGAPVRVGDGGHECPRHYASRELIDADIWIATPASLVHSAVPTHQNAERIRYLELACRRSDLIVVDEADRVQMQLDVMFAPATTLVGRAPNSWLDEVQQHKIEELARGGRVQLFDSDVMRWTAATHTVSAATDRIYAMLLQDRDLRSWVEADYFSAWTLQYKLVSDWFELEQHGEPDPADTLDRPDPEWDDDIDRDGDAESVVDGDGPAADGMPRQAERRNEVLGAVVQVPLDSAAFGIGGVDRAGPAGRQRLDAPGQRLGPGRLQQRPGQHEVERRGALGQPGHREHQCRAEGESDVPPEGELAAGACQHDERRAHQRPGDDRGGRHRIERTAEGVVAHLSPGPRGHHLTDEPAPAAPAGAVGRERHKLLPEDRMEAGPLPGGEPGGQRGQHQQGHRERDHCRDQVSELLGPIDADAR